MDETQDYFSLKKLQIELLLWALFWVSGFLCGAILVLNDMGWETALKSSMVMLGLGGFFFVSLWKDIPLNRSVSYGMLYPTLGLANHISIFRGLLITVLAGFVFLPIDGGWLEWAPGILFLTISLLDFADGAAARFTGRFSLLGEQLDMRLDGAGVLFGSIILIMIGKAPIYFVVVGLVRYLYVFGQFALLKTGKPVFPLPSNPYRRALAGTMMGFISITLFPIFSPVVTSVAAILFLIPFLIGFWQDWLYTSGVISPDQGIKLPVGLPYDLFPDLIRIAAGCFLIFSPAFPTDISNFSGFMFSLLTIMGLFPRVSVLGLLLFTGNLLSHQGSDPMLWAALFFASASFFLGGGRFAIWSPENWLIYHRVGDED
ncbi:MAG: CDP-alcohol phosphatidyltransferase family protein [Leptolinea sp.]